MSSVRPSPSSRTALPAAAALLLAGVLASGRARGDEPAAPPPAALPGPFERIRVVDFPGEIGSLLAAYTKRQAAAAKDEGVDCLVLRIESPGGLVSASMEIGDALLALPASLHVVAWVPREAYSGAAMVALACDEMVMGRDAHLGDAQPILLGPEGITPAGEKLESPLRAKFRAYAERNGYPIALAEAMVSASVEVLRVRAPDGGTHLLNGKDYRDAAPDAVLVGTWTKTDLVQVGGPVVREGQLLTMTAQEARDLGFLRRTFADGAPFPADEDAFLAALRAPGATVERIGLSFSERASRVLLDLAGILSAVVALALVVTMFQGIGTMTIVGAVALALVLVINATADQLHGFPLFLVAIGALLIAAEVFLIPGFGVAGVLGIFTLGAGFLALALGLAPGGDAFPVGRGPDVVAFGLQFVVTVLAGIAVLVLLAGLAPRLGPARRLVLAAPSALPAAAGRTPGFAPRLGERGVARSALRPAGSIEVRGHLVDVTTEGPYVDPGRRVEVVAVEGHVVTVRAIDEGPPA